MNTSKSEPPRPSSEAHDTPLPDEQTIRVLLHEHQIFREAIEHSPLQFCVYDEQDRLIAWNPAYQMNHPEAFAHMEANPDAPLLTYGEIIRFQLEQEFSGAELEREIAKRVEMQRTATGAPVEREYASVGWLKVLKYGLPSGAYAGLAVNINDLKAAERERAAKAVELEEAYRKMRHQALHDALTGLPNRRYLDEYFEKVGAIAAAGSQQLVVMHIDLDKFKQLNDTQGHGAGDRALQHVGATLRGLKREGDFAARIGGDEFVLICLWEPGAQNMGHFANRLLNAICTPFDYNGTACLVGASIGIAPLENPSISLRELLANADLALYQAKSQPRSCIAFYGTTRDDGDDTASAAQSS